MLVKLFFINRIIDILCNWISIRSAKYVWKHFQVVCFHLVYSFSLAISCIAWWEGMEMLEIFSYHKVAQFTDQNEISATVCCIRYVMVCKIVFTNWNANIALLRGSMVVTHYIKTFPNGGRQTQRYFNVSSPSSRWDK